MKPAKYYDIWDAVIVLGFIAVGVGIWMIYTPAALIVMGVSAIIVGSRMGNN